MSKALFVNGNVHGHINPTIPLVKELVRRGEEVVYFSTGEFQQKIESAGAEFMDYGQQFSKFLCDFKPTGNHPFYTLIEFILKMDRVVVPLIFDKIKDIKFDYIIHDAMFGGGNIIARMLDLPAVCSCTSFAMNKLPMPSHMLQPGFHPQLDSFYKELEAAKEDWGMNTLNVVDLFFKKESLNLVFTSKMFQPEADSFDDSFKFVGPSIAKRNETLEFSIEKVAGEKVIYISMGTINNDCLEFYQKCFEAFTGENLKVVLAIGRKVDINLLHIPDNFIVKSYLPQLEVLENAALFISHGGLNSVSEALYFGVPIIVIPQANDQPMVAQQVVKLGAGVNLKKEEVTSRLLQDTAWKVLSDQSYRQMSQKIGESFRTAGGYQIAADYIMELKKGLGAEKKYP